MVFFLVTALVSAVIVFLGASLLERIFKKVASGYAASLGAAWTTVAIVSVTTAAYMFVMTRPSIVGPYEQWTFQNIGGQLLGGVLVVGVKIWIDKMTES